VLIIGAVITDVGEAIVEGRGAMLFCFFTALATALVGPRFYRPGSKHAERRQNAKQKLLSFSNTSASRTNRDHFG